MDKTYADERLTVLDRIYRMGNQKAEEWVEYGALFRELPALQNPLHSIVKDLAEELGYIGGSGEHVWMLPRGIEFLQGTAHESSKPIFNTTNIHGPNYGNVQTGGEGNV